MLDKLPEGTVTVLFTDVEGSTDLITSLGDQSAHARLQTQAELVRRQAKEHGGREVRSMGDGFMIAFASARAAVACAVSIQQHLDADNRSHAAEEKVGIRIGLHTGEVIRGDGDLSGHAVNSAARIMAKAGAGQILISDTVKGVLGHSRDTELVDRGRFRMKDFPQRWRLYEVLWRTDETNVDAAPAPAERTPFVGRTAEAAALRLHLDRAAAGCGGLIMIGGEPGVGKTRLADELLREARQRGMTALTGRCYEMEGAPPYFPFVEILQAAMRIFPAPALRAVMGDCAPEVAKLIPEVRRTLSDIPEPLELPLEQERHYMFNGMREFVRRAGLVQPMLLVFDDLHWADDSTLLLLQHIAHGLPEMPVLIIGTYRDVEIEPGRPLTRALEALVRQRLAHKITLRRFASADVAAMLHGISGREPPSALAEVIYSDTEGNPFFVEEVFRHLAEEGKLFDSDGRWRSDLQVNRLEVPDSIRLVIGRRLQRVTEDCRRVLTIAAIIGREFSFALLEISSDLSEEALLDAIDQAERAQLITSATEGPEDRFAFVHELIRQTLLSDVSVPRKQRLHLEVAEAMERLSGPAVVERASDLTYHLYQAGNAADPRKTARYLALAGERALGAVALEEALRLYDSALALHTPADRRERADLLFKRALTVRGLGDLEEALANWREALAGYEQLGDREAASHACAIACQQLWWSSRFEDALDFSLRGLAGLGKRVTPERCLLLAVGGVTLSLGGFYRLGELMINQAMGLAEELGDGHLLGKVFAHKAVHYLGYAQFADLVHAGQKGATLLRAAGDLSELLNTLWVTQFGLACLGRFDDAVELGKEVEALAVRLNNAGALMVTRRVVKGRELLTTGNIDWYEQFARDDLELCLSSNLPWISTSYTDIGLTMFWRGDWAAALENFEQAVGLEQPGVLSGIEWAYLFLMRAYMRDKDGALAMLRQKKALVPSSDVPLRSRISLVFRLIRAARSCGLGLIGLLGDARRIRLANMEHHLPRAGRPSTLGSWMMLTGVVEGLVVLGERRRAAKFYALAAEGFASTGAAMRLWDRLAVTIRATLAGAAGRWDESEEHFQAALRLADEIPARIEQPEARRFYARMLMDRGAAGDREKASQLLHEAVTMYREIGMPKHLEMAEQMLAETAPSPASAQASVV